MKKIRFLGILLAITVFATYSLSINVLANDVCNASEGIFEIPYNCPQCFRWTRMSAKAEHGPISYRNPYE